MRSKVFILFFLMLILIQSVSLAETIMLKAGHSKAVSGKNISLVLVYSDFISVDVDGIQKEINVVAVTGTTDVNFSSRTTYINGVNVTVTNLFERQQTAELSVETGYVCGDRVCSSKESSTICCKDCNCSSGYSCLDNRCIKTDLNYCLKASDCNDSKICTADLCEGLPRKCYNLELELCKDNDRCCPANCYYENDSDCPRNKTQFECFALKDCASEGCNLATSCDNGKCVYGVKEGCEFNKTCVSFYTRQSVNGKDSYCDSAGWQQQKKADEECAKNQECLDNLCENGKCKQTQTKSTIPEKKETIPPKTNLWFLSIGAVVLVIILIYAIMKLAKR